MIRVIDTFFFFFTRVSKLSRYYVARKRQGQEKYTPSLPDLDKDSENPSTRMPADYLMRHQALTGKFSAQFRVIARGIANEDMGIIWDCSTYRVDRN